MSNLLEIKSMIALGLALVLGLAGFNGYKTIMSKAQSQTQVNEGIHSYRSSYMALEESMKAWEKSYPPAGSVSDLLSLRDLLGLNRLGLEANTDKMTLASVDPVTQNGSPIGLTRVCLTNAGNTEFHMTAPDFGTLFSGLKKLASRPDISMGVFVISGEKEARAKINDLCLLMRN